MIKKNLVRHSMGVLVKEEFFFRPITLNYEERIIYRWILKVHGLPINNILDISRSAPGDILFFVRVESRPNINVERQVINGNYLPVRQTWNPIELKIKDTISDVNVVEFLRGWMESDRKFDVTLEKLDPVGVTKEKWQLYGSFIQEMHNEIVYDRTIGDITIRLNYDYANLLNFNYL
jgi:hypothetical protein